MSQSDFASSTIAKVKMILFQEKFPLLFHCEQCKGLKTDLLLFFSKGRKQCHIFVLTQ